MILQRVLNFIDKHGSIRLQEYANLSNLSPTSASRELVLFVANPLLASKPKAAVR